MLFLQGERNAIAEMLRSHAQVDITQVSMMWGIARQPMRLLQPTMASGRGAHEVLAIHVDIAVRIGAARCEHPSIVPPVVVLPEC